MANEIIKIDGIEMKKSKNGRTYHSINSENEKFTVFEGEVLDKLKECYAKGFKAEVEIAESNGFKNIRNFIQMIEIEKPKEKTEKTEITEKTENKEKGKTSMYVSYAKDLYIAYMQAGADMTDDLTLLCCNAIDRMKSFFDDKEC
jgi:hypothetical protein